MRGEQRLEGVEVGGDGRELDRRRAAGGVKGSHLHGEGAGDEMPGSGVQNGQVQARVFQIFVIVDGRGVDRVAY